MRSSYSDGTEGFLYDYMQNHYKGETSPLKRGSVPSVPYAQFLDTER